jgi:hypothetical protein
VIAARRSTGDGGDEVDESVEDEEDYEEGEPAHAGEDASED